MPPLQEEQIHRGRGGGTVGLVGVQLTILSGLRLGILQLFLLPSQQQLFRPSSQQRPRTGWTAKLSDMIERKVGVVLETVRKARKSQSLVQALDQAHLGKARSGGVPGIPCPKSGTFVQVGCLLAVGSVGKAMPLSLR